MIAYPNDQHCVTTVKMIVCIPNFNGGVSLCNARSRLCSFNPACCASPIGLLYSYTPYTVPIYKKNSDGTDSCSKKIAEMI